MASPARKPFPAAKYANVPAFAPVAVPQPVAVPARKAAEQHQARKCDQASRVLDKLEARSAVLAARIKALQKVKAACDARYSKIEDRIIAELQGAGFDHFNGVRVEFQLRNAPLALQVENESEIPPHFFREKLTTSVDKLAIKAAMQAGEEVPGCSLTQKVSLCRK